MREARTADALVFAAFSGSHQDAIAKGMHWTRGKRPRAAGRFRICRSTRPMSEETTMQMSSVSTASPVKGGVGYILETKYGLNLPPKMREAMGYAAKAVSDHSHKELHPDEIFEPVQIHFRKCGAAHTASAKYISSRKTAESLLR